MRQGDSLALAFTAMFTAFIGAIVVLTIPVAALSTPLPASVNPLGLSVEVAQQLFVGRIWYLLIPSGLFAAWVGYKSYQIARKADLTQPDE